MQSAQNAQLEKPTAYAAQLTNQTVQKVSSFCSVLWACEKGYALKTNNLKAKAPAKKNFQKSVQ